MNVSSSFFPCVVVVSHRLVLPLLRQDYINSGNRYGIEGFVMDVCVSPIVKLRISKETRKLISLNIRLVI